MDILYILSKIFTFFLAPEVWIIVLLILCYLTKAAGRKKRLMISAVIVFVVFGNEALYKLSVNAWQPSPVSLANNYEAGIVLGGFVGFDSEGRGYMKNDADRFYAAVKLYNAGTIKKIIVSGGTVAKDQPEEAEYIKNEMIAIGIRAEDIISETQSKSTYENVRFTKLIIDSLHFRPPYILITSSWHMPRAARLFEKAGLHVIAFPCAYNVIKNEQLTLNDWLIPKVRILDEWQKIIKEIVGTSIYIILNKG